MNRVFSTRELAALCGVNESTIKRWADSGKLVCIKTPGGHRKFKVSDVLCFMQRHGFDTSLLGVGPTESGSFSSAVRCESLPDPDLDNWIRNRETAALVTAYVNSALQGGRIPARTLVLRLFAAGYSPIDICDHVIGPALESVGARWSDGQLSVLQEHLISSATLEALTVLGEAMEPAEPRGLRALCCSWEDDLHNLGVRMTALALDSIGWETATSLWSAPLAEVSNHVEQARPDLVCLSLVYRQAHPQPRPGYAKLWAVSRVTGTRIALGGRGVTTGADRGGEPAEVDLPCDFRGQSLNALVAWAGQLAPFRR